MATPTADGVPFPIGDPHLLPAHEVATRLDVDAEQGLTSDEASARAAPGTVPTACPSRPRAAGGSAWPTSSASS